MTQREAIETLMRHAAKNVAGVGQGIRALPSPQEREKVKEAIRVMWPKAFKFECNDTALRNLGL